jgi:hypothetical protein
LLAAFFQFVKFAVWPIFTHNCFCHFTVFEHLWKCLVCNTLTTAFTSSSVSASLCMSAEWVTASKISPSEIFKTSRTRETCLS